MSTTTNNRRKQRRVINDGEIKDTSKINTIKIENIKIENKLDLTKEEENNKRRQRRVVMDGEIKKVFKEDEEKVKIENQSFQAAHSTDKKLENPEELRRGKIRQTWVDNLEEGGKRPPIIKQFMGDEKIEEYRRLLAKSYKCQDIDITYEKIDPYIYYYLTRIDGSKKMIQKFNYTGQAPARPTTVDKTNEHIVDPDSAA